MLSSTRSLSADISIVFVTDYTYFGKGNGDCKEPVQEQEERVRASHARETPLSRCMLCVINHRTDTFACTRNCRSTGRQKPCCARRSIKKNSSIRPKPKSQTSSSLYDACGQPCIGLIVPRMDTCRHHLYTSRSLVVFVHYPLLGLDCVASSVLFSGVVAATHA